MLLRADLTANEMVIELNPDFCRPTFSPRSSVTQGMIEQDCRTLQNWNLMYRQNYGRERDWSPRIYLLGHRVILCL
jgi:hypothetical protein